MGRIAATLPLLGISALETPAANGTYELAFNAGQSAANGILAQSFSTVTGFNYVLSFDFGTTWGGTQALRRRMSAQQNPRTCLFLLQQRAIVEHSGRIVNRNNSHYRL